MKIKIYSPNAKGAPMNLNATNGNWNNHPDQKKGHGSNEGNKLEALLKLIEG